MSNPLYPIECSDDYGLQGLYDAKDLAEWLNSWLNDPDTKRCVIEKMPNPKANYAPFSPDNYQLAPATAGDHR
jgi:hypothetical protein